MAIEITMPRLSDTMEQGTVVSWHVGEGDEVSSGDVIADIETDKATMELQTFDDGTIAKLVAGEGKQVAVGSLIAVLAEEGEDLSDAAASVGDRAEGASGEGRSEAASSRDQSRAESKADAGGGSGGGSAAAVAETEESEPAGGTSANGTASGAASGGEPAGRGAAAGSEDGEASGRVFASPLARKLARERGIDLRGLEGSGPSGRIVKKDVEHAAERGAAPAGAPEAAAPERAPLPAGGAALEPKNVPLSNMRATIAKRLIESKQTVPHYQVTVSARLDNLLSLREQLNDQLASMAGDDEKPAKLSVNDFLVKACALAMHQHPFVNSSWNDDGPSIDLHGRVNVGVAVALPEERGGGLVVATLRDADRRGLRDLSQETKRLAKKARDKGLTIEEMSDSTFTISNLGMFGVDHFNAIINPPNAAILAVGRAIQKPFVTTDEDGETTIEIGSEMAMTMSSDHRIVDGAMAAQYLGTVKQLLENPATLLV